MEIKREIIRNLIEWKDKTNRKPLIIQGARQIGKTWIMKQFGKDNFQHTAYYNFEQSPEIKQDLINTKDPHRIIEILRLYTTVPIEAGKTLIIFDEIQEFPEMLNSLKYFCEEASEYHIISAGSLLGVAIHSENGFPVGKVEFLNMYPVTFKEFINTSEPKIYDYIDNCNDFASIPVIYQNLLNERYKQYRICGGMPEAVVASLSGAGIKEIEDILRNIIESFSMDFTKHAQASEFPKITAIWNSIPSQLAKENRKFIYKIVKSGARAREYENALLWLERAGLIYKIFCISKPGVPITAYDDLSAFKIYTLDSALLRVMAGMPAEIFNTEMAMYNEFKGALAENSVLNALVPQLDILPRYWVSSGTAEVDFIISLGLDIIPVEVKAGTNTSGKSLSVYIGKYHPREALICSALPYSVKQNAETAILNLPHSLATWITQITEIKH